MELQSGPASGGRETGTSGDGGEDHGYPVNSSCPSTSRALSIPHIRERVVNLSMSPLTMSSFSTVRAVGRAWQETAFDAIKKRIMKQPSLSNLSFERFVLPLSGDIVLFSGDEPLYKTERFLDKITPDALLPLVPVFNINKLDLPLATRLVEGYAHVFVGFHLYIDSQRGGLSDLDKKLEVFHGRDYCRLQTVVLNVFARPALAEEIQMGLDAVEKLTGSLPKLTKFQVILTCDFAREDQLVLPSRITDLDLSGRYSLQALLHPRNTLPRLKRLRFSLEGIELEPQTKLRNFLERSTKLEQLCIDGWVPPLKEAPLSLPLTQLKSLKEITLMGLNYAVETTSGSDALPNLSTAELCIELNLEKGEVARLGVLGRLLRNATRFTLYVDTSQSAVPRMEPLSECFSNVTRLFWTSDSGWETLVVPLSHVFLRMTCLQRICVTFRSGSVDEPPLDLFRFLTGLKEPEIPEEEKAIILNGRGDAVTNLRRLRSLTICAEIRFEPVSPFLFEAIFNSMPELIEIKIYSSDPNPFINVQEMVTAWRATGKQISHQSLYM